MALPPLFQTSMNVHTITIIMIFVRRQIVALDVTRTPSQATSHRVLEIHLGDEDES